MIGIVVDGFTLRGRGIRARNAGMGIVNERNVKNNKTERIYSAFLYYFDFCDLWNDCFFGFAENIQRDV